RRCGAPPRHLPHVLLARVPGSSSPCRGDPRALPSFPTRRSSDLLLGEAGVAPGRAVQARAEGDRVVVRGTDETDTAVSLPRDVRSEEHTSELQSRENLVCRLLLEKKKPVTDTRSVHVDHRRIPSL